jgi:uncharacterized protein
MNLLTLVFGFVFGSVLQYSRLNKYDVISGLARREDFTVPKAIALAVGLGAILLNAEIALGLASYHAKPFIVGGVIIGGLIFGSGMAILGYCPGTLAVSLGEGSLDALTGIAGGLAGGVVYTLVLPQVSKILGPDLGVITLNSLTGTNFLFFLILLLAGTAFIMIAFRLERFDRQNDRKWIVSGIIIAILNLLAFSTALFNRPIGASTAYPYLADMGCSVTHNGYFDKIKGPGSWELIFLAGSFLSGLVISLIRKDFKLILLHETWKKHKGNSPINRVIWAFAGGFILIFGARMAGGCTSGHILSGGMQMAFSSLIFAVFTFAGLLATGRVFYGPKSN